MKFRKPGIILNPNESWFFAIHTTKSTSCINIAPPIKQLVIEDENLAIWPGHHWRSHGIENEFFESMLTNEETWRIPCGILYYKILQKVWVKNTNKKILFFCFERKIKEKKMKDYRN